MCLWVTHKKIFGQINFLASLKSLKKGVISVDPDPHKNVTDPQH